MSIYQPPPRPEPGENPAEVVRRHYAAAADKIVDRYLADATALPAPTAIEVRADGAWRVVVRVSHAAPPECFVISGLATLVTDDRAICFKKTNGETMAWFPASSVVSCVRTEP